MLTHNLRMGIAFSLLLFMIGFPIILLVQNRSLAFVVHNFAQPLPAMSPIVYMPRGFYESTYTLLQWKPILASILIGLISWSGKCGALYYVYFRSIQHIHLFGEGEDEGWQEQRGENARALPLEASLPCFLRLTDAAPALVTTINRERVQ